VILRVDCEVWNRPYKTYPQLRRDTRSSSQEKSVGSGIRETAAIHAADTLTCAAYVEGHTQQFDVLDTVGWVPKAGKHPGERVKIMRDHRNTPSRSVERTTTLL